VIWTKLDKGLKIQDNVLGFIELNKEEASLVQHPFFQRLKNIKQLGFNNFVFPGATHTRFAHSLGVFELLKRIINSLKNQTDSDEKSIMIKYEKELKFAAILHYIGHYPFSHVMESYFDKKHEKNGKDLLKKSDIDEYLKSLSCNTEVIYNIITGEFAPSNKNEFFLRQLLNSDLDADRLDYLMRDSLHTGVPFGSIDLDNIIRHAVLTDGFLHFNKKAVRSIDHYLNARVSMYDTVYSHKTAIAFDAMFNRICDIIAREHIIPFQEIIRDDSVNMEEFFQFDDNYLLSTIHNLYRIYKQKSSRNPTEEKDFDLISDFLTRVPYKLIHEASSFLMRDNAEKIRNHEQSKKIAKRIENFKVDLDIWLEEDPIRSSIVLIKEGKPLVFSKGFPQVNSEDSSDDKAKWKIESIRIIDPKTNQKDYIHDVTNSIIFFLSGYALRSIKVYSKNRQYENEIKSLWEKTAH